MKRIITLVLLASFVFTLSGCGGNKQESPSEIKTEVQDESFQESPKEDKSLNVDKGLFDVTITVPSSLIDASKIDETIAEAKENGAKDIVKNDDGSLTYKLSKKDHKKLMDEMKKSVDESLNSLSSGENFKSIKDVEINDDCTKATLTVDRAKYEKSLDSMAILMLAIAPPMYQVFNGVEPDKINIEVNLKDSSSGEVFNTYNYPKDLKK